MDWERVYIPRWGCAIHKIHDTENLYEIEEGDFGYLLCIYKLDSDSKKVEYKFDSLDEAKKFSERLLKINKLINHGSC